MHGQQVTNGGEDSDLTMVLLGDFVRKRWALSNGQCGLPAKDIPMAVYWLPEARQDFQRSSRKDDVLHCFRLHEALLT